MAASAAILDFARELFAGLGGVTTRRMFGGAGVYCDDVMFGLIDDEVIYVKVDAELKAELAAAGSVMWVYTRADGKWEDSAYWSLPETAMDDPEEACAWGRKSVAAAVALRKPKRKR